MVFERRRIRATTGRLPRADALSYRSFYFLDLTNSFVSSPITMKEKISRRFKIAFHCGSLPFKRRDCASSMTLFPDTESKVAISRAASSLRNCKNPLLVRIASPISSALRASPCARTIMDWKRGAHQLDSVSMMTNELPASLV